jgi:hypothetical protein
VLIAIAGVVGARIAGSAARTEGEGGEEIQGCRAGEVEGGRWARHRPVEGSLPALPSASRTRGRGGWEGAGGEGQIWRE